MIFPDLEKAIQMCLELRDILKEVIIEASSSSDDDDLRNIKEFLEYNNNDKLGREFDNDTSRLIAARNASK